MTSKSLVVNPDTVESSPLFLTNETKTVEFASGLTIGASIFGVAPRSPKPSPNAITASSELNTSE